MRIAVITATRDRPAGVVTLSNMLYQLASGENQITHFLSRDDDDEPILPAHLLPPFVYVVTNPRPDTLGEVWNAPFREMGDNWDICTIIADDVYPVTPHWDRGVVAMAAKSPVSAWQENNDPYNAGHTIMTRAFIKAMGGEPYTRWFPFWFDDPWLNEVFTFASGKGIPIVTDMKLHAREHGVCQGMRDLSFWIDFWIKSRSQRIEQGQRLATALGGAPIDPAPAIRVFEELDRQWPERIPRIEQACGADRGAPPARYLRAKARAQAWLDSQTAPGSR